MLYDKLHPLTAQKMKLSIKNLVTLTEEILNEELHLLCSVCFLVNDFRSVW